MKLPQCYSDIILEILLFREESLLRTPPPPTPECILNNIRNKISFQWTIVLLTSCNSLSNKTNQQFNINFPTNHKCL